MGALGLCGDDPVVTTLREAFGANIVRVPDERYRPLSVLAAHDQSVSFRGALAPLIKGDPPAFPEPATSQLPDVAGKKTKSIDLGLGLQILGGLLQGLGAGAAGLDAQFRGVRQVSYGFKDVLRLWQDLNAIGRLLEGRAIDQQNPAAALFFGPHAYTLLVIDSVITSSAFTLSAAGGSDSGFTFDVPGIAQAIGASSAGVSVSSESGKDLTFAGAKQLAFAFSCVHLEMAKSGKIGTFLPDGASRGVDLFARPMHGAAAARRVLLSGAPAMIDVA
jgi:hypothetical protein